MDNSSQDKPDEFDAFLADSVEADQHKFEAEALLNDLSSRFEDRLHEFGWERAEPESDRGKRLYAGFLEGETSAIDQYLDGRRPDEAADSADLDELAGLADKQARTKAELVLVTEDMNINFIVANWAMAEQVLVSAADTVKAETLAHRMKVELYARLLVENDYPPDGAIVRATNALLPGGELAPDDHDVGIAIMAARETKANKKDATKAILAAGDAAYDATDIMIYEDGETAELMRYAVHEISNMVMVRSVTEDHDDPTWQAEREALVRERAAEEGLNSRYADQLVRHFKDFRFE